MSELTIPDDASTEDLITEPAEDADGYRHEDLEEGSTVVYEGEIHTVAGIGRSAIMLGHDPQIMVREGGAELVVGVESDADEGDESDDEGDDDELELVVAGATERDDSEYYCRVTVDGKRVAATDVVQTESGLELYTDDDVVMRIDATEGAERAADAIRGAIEDRTSSRVTVTGTLVDWDPEQATVSDTDE